MFARKNLKYLEKWKLKPSRKPLLLRGARQVGKSSLVRIFSRSFASFAEVNLEIPRHKELLSKAKDLHAVLQAIEFLTNTSIKDNETLVFIDEVQQLPELITQLRFFYEHRPNLHVIAAGSHFEATVKRGGFSIPVGRVEHHYLFPLSFDEFLLVTGKERVLEQLNSTDWSTPPSAVLHDEALKLLGNYMVWGGMPEVVKMLREGATHQELTPIFEGLLLGYMEDV